MERLTIKQDEEYYIKTLNEDCTVCASCEKCEKHINQLVKILGAYEDTGLTPEEIEQLKKQQERDEGCAYCDIAKNSPIVYLEYLNQFGFLGGNTQVDEVTRKSISHCPMCGRKLVE